MQAPDYSFAKRKLATAVNSIAMRSTIYEGLYVACTESLSWIDPDTDLPASQRAAFLAWRNSLLPELSTPGASTSLLAKLRELDDKQIENKVSRLLDIANAVQQHR